MGAAVGLGDAEVGQQLGDDLGFHGRAAVGVERQLVCDDLLFGVRLGDQAFGQGGRLLGGDHPADDVAAEDVQDDVQIVVGPLGRPLELGVSRPREFHPRPLREPDVNLSAHPAPIIQP